MAFYNRSRVAHLHAILAVVLIVPACGTRQSHEAVVRSATGWNPSAPGPGAETGQATGAQDHESGLHPAGGSLAADLGANGDAGPRTTVVTSTDRADPLEPARPPTAGAPHERRAPTAGTPTDPVRSQDVSSTVSPRPEADSTSGAGRPVAPGVTIKLGLVGTFSGPTGPFFIHHLQGVQLWQRWVNGRTGVKGHPVQIIVADNAGDPARHRALTQELVEGQHVLAFINNVEVFSGPSAIEYLEGKRIPVIGLSGSEPHAYSSPMYFPQSSAGHVYYDTMFASWAQQMIPQGKRRLAILACAESQVCQQIYDETEQQTTRRGLQLSYKARISLAQPDFTAECIAARNAATDLLFVLADGNTQRRVVTSCDRQGFRPVFVSAAEAVNHDLQDEATMNNRLISSLVTFPYLADTPTAAEFQAARKQYGSDLKPGAGLTIGWVAGKLFERAMAQTSEPPTTEDLLRGLWSIKNDDLGGITGPLTFTAGQPATPIACWWNLAIIDAKWRSPDGFQRHCDQ